MNVINYISHAIHEPGISHRRFELDVPHLQETAKRVAVAALPFISLYRPAGFTLSIGMGSVRAFSHLQQAFLEGDQKHWKKCSIELGQAALATLSLAATVFNFTTGLLVVTGFDTVQSLMSACQNLLLKEYTKAGEEVFQAAMNALYLSFMVTGQLEIMVAFVLLQAVFSLYQAKGEIGKGRYLEAGAKMAMSGIRVYQARNYITLIQKRNILLTLEKTRNIFLKALRGKHPTHLINHPLSSLKDRIEGQETILTNAKGEEFSFGSHFHGLGEALVKGDNLTFRTYYSPEGKEITELDFKVNHVFRETLTSSIEELRKVSPKDLHDMLLLAGSHTTGISVTKVDPDNDFFFFFDSGALEQTIQFEGLGTITIGANSELPNLYDRVVVRMDSTKTLYDLNEMLAFLDLDRAIRLSTRDDIERMKMGHLFRIFYPREATLLERTEEFFTLPLDQLKETMIEKAPLMKELFESYLPRMKEAEILPGRVRYRVEGLSEAAYALGARALTSAVTNAYSDQELFQRVASMLKMGMLSTELRDESNMNINGLSGGGDYYSGGADSIFTQLLTEKNCRENLEFDRLYHSKVRFLISLDALEYGSYQFHEDNWGTRKVEPPKWVKEFWGADTAGSWYLPYTNRPGILEFIQEEQESLYGHYRNEVMLKERIDPSLFTGLVVPDEVTKADLLAYLTSCNLVQEGKILGHLADEFIRVGKQVTEELIG
jgi:hypothetical protein